MKTLFFALMTASLFSLQVYAEKREPLPEPLTYQAAINYIEKYPNYNLLNSQAELMAARANKNSAESQDDFSLILKGYLRKVGVSRLGNPDDDNDSKISLIAKKKLYDFGLSDYTEDLATSKLIYAKLNYEYKKELEILNLIQAYFNVLRADNAFLVQNEAMAIAYIRYNRQVENNEFGLSSDISILKQQTNYERVRQMRYLAEANQRRARQQLAELMGVPESPADNIEVPKINLQRKIINDTVLLTQLALKNSKKLQLKHLEVIQAKQAVNYLDQTINASIEAELEASNYQRESAFRDDWRASINFTIPLFEGNRQTSKEELAKANLMSASTDFEIEKSSLRQKVLELWQLINQKTVELEGAIIKQDYRDLYLERSRADYELEYKSDLGDAMVQFSQSRKERYDTEFDLELAWKRLEILIGKENMAQVIQVDKPKLN